MKNFPNTLLALLFAASGALFVSPAAADLRWACVKNEMLEGTLINMRVHYKHYYKSKDASGPWRWKKSRWSPVVGRRLTTCVDLDKIGVKMDTGFWIESEAQGKIKGAVMKCGRVIRRKNTPAWVAYARQGHLFNKGVCNGPYYFRKCSLCSEGRGFRESDRNRNW